MSLASETTLTAPPPLVDRLRAFAGDVKISHSVFALPWALLAMCLASTANPPHGLPFLGQVLLVVACMVTARTFAMALNRALDAGLDRLNPRTARRAIPSGRLSTAFVVAVAGVCAAAFWTACAGFWVAYGNPWPAVLAPAVLFLLGVYPLLKRFTRLCHYYLGFCLALAPPCAWLAIRGDLALPPMLMSLAVLLWTAGFDIIYSCQDVEADRQTGVFSVPSALGVGPALWVARATHVGCVLALAWLGQHVPQFGAIYLAGVAVAIGLLVIEHSLVSKDDLSKVNLAFFTINGVISLVIGSLGIIDIYV